MDIQTPYKSILLADSTATHNFYKKTDASKGTVAIFPGFAQTVNGKNKHLLLNTIFNVLIETQYEIITIETFINDIQSFSPEIQAKCSYEFFQKLFDDCMTNIYGLTSNLHIIAHSTPTIPLTLHFTKRIKNNEKIPITSATFFAPFPTHPGILDTLCRITPDENEKKQIDNLRPLAQRMFELVPTIEPKLLSKIAFSMALICGKKDKIAPIDNTIELVKNAANPHITSIFVSQNHNFGNLSGKFAQTILQKLSIPDRPDARFTNNIYRQIMLQKPNTK